MESSVLPQMFVISPYKEQKQSGPLINVLFATFLSPVCPVASQPFSFVHTLLLQGCVRREDPDLPRGMGRSQDPKIK